MLKKTLDYLYSNFSMFSRTGGEAYHPGVETTLKIAALFDNPHKKIKSIHVGGTNGKGSTSNMLAAILEQQGYKTALFTSPHLTNFRERIRINGQMIPEEYVVEFFNTWKEKYSHIKSTFFEITTILAFKWFADENVDYAVIEVGMGGRLDSTNIISPLLSIITNISFDHNQFLGDTLEQIAFEKAGIIKPHTPVIIGESQPETEQVFIEKAISENAPIFFADKVITDLEMTEENTGGWKCNWNRLHFFLPLGGDYQKANLKTVLASVMELRKLGVTIFDDSIKEGLENIFRLTGFFGRWSIISGSPLTIADTGHNIAGLSYNFRQLQNLLNDRKDAKLRIVIGFVADKAIDKILMLMPREAVYYVTNAQIPRALPSNILKEKFLMADLKSEAYDNVPDAYLQAKKEASDKDIIFIGGSTFIVADFLHYLDSCAGSDS